MNIRIKLKNYPAAGKVVQHGKGKPKYCVVHEGKTRRLPYFIWRML